MLRADISMLPLIDMLLYLSFSPPPPADAAIITRRRR